MMRENGYTKYFGYRYYKLEIGKTLFFIIDLERIKKPIEDFMFLLGLMSIEKFEKYLTDMITEFAVSMEEFNSTDNTRYNRCGIDNPYVVYFKQRFYSINVSDFEVWVFDLADITKPIKFFKHSWDKSIINTAKFEKYLKENVHYEIYIDDDLYEFYRRFRTFRGGSFYD